MIKAFANMQNENYARMRTQTPCLKIREAIGRGNDNLRTQRTEDEKCTKTKKHQKHIKDIQGSRISP